MDRFTERASLYKSESERFQEYLKNLPDDAWSRQSACDEWLVGDVVAHLIGNAEFYAGTVARGVGGESSPPEGRPEAGTGHPSISSAALAKSSIAAREKLGDKLLALIPLAISAAQGKLPQLQIFGTDYPTPDGTCLRDYIHVDDLCRAHIAAFPKLEEPGQTLFYNLGTGSPTSVREVISAVETVSGRQVPVEETSRRSGDPPELYADSSKAQNELDWEIQYPDIVSIVQTAWNWHESHPEGYS